MEEPKIDVQPVVGWGIDTIDGVGAVITFSVLPNLQAKATDAVQLRPLGIRTAELRRLLKELPGVIDQIENRKRRAGH